MRQLWDRLTFGPARRRRWSQRVLTELEQLEATGAAPVPVPTPLWRRRGGRGRTGRRGVVVLVVALVLLAGSGAQDILGWLHSAGLGVGQDSFTRSYGADAPPPGVGEAAAPLGTPPAAPPGSGDYAFLRTDGGQPVAYDPCRAIHYVLRDHGESPDLRAEFDAAVGAVSAATGLRFVFDGSTEEVPSRERAPYQPSRYGKRWAPVLVAFTDATESPELAGNVLGDGGSIAVAPANVGGLSGGTGHPSYVTGQIRLDAPDLERPPPGMPRLVFARAVMEHELGHLVGLDHVGDPTQLMYPELKDQRGYADGDLRGLAKLGAGVCQPRL